MKKFIISIYDILNGVLHSQAIDAVDWKEAFTKHILFPKDFMIDEFNTPKELCDNLLQCEYHTNFIELDKNFNIIEY